jgi:endo-1,4-beta-xylanase
VRALFVFILVLSSIAFSENKLSNGHMEFGDGGWYLWVNPDGKGKASMKIKQGYGTQGSIGARVQVDAVDATNWHVQFQVPDWIAEKGKNYRLSYKARSEAKKIIHTAIMGGAPGWEYVDGADAPLNNSWQEFSQEFEAHRGGFKQMRVHLFLTQKGVYYFDDFYIEEVAPPDTIWYSEADSRIEQIRKGDFKIKVTDKEGNPLINQKLKVKLSRHAFPFGTALNLNVDSDEERWYRKTATDLFWEGVTENAFKWPEYEHKKNKPNRKYLKEYTDFALKHGWTLRGHALEWGIEKYGFDQHWARQGSCEEYRKHLKNRIDRDLKEYKGLFQEYDVWNEVFHEPAIFNRCGWDLLDSSFHWAHRADPTAVLYVNEYQVVSSGGTETYFEIIKGLLDRGVPVQGIGVQCHFNGKKIIPALIKSRLDRLGELGLPIKVTEFDIGDHIEGLGVSEEEQAILMERFIRTAFSHPKVQGLLFWGFWDNRHWLKNGGIFRADRSPKPAVAAIKKLWSGWSTQKEIQTDSQGFAEFRGFFGTYELEIANQKGKLGLLKSGEYFWKNSR